MHDLNLITTLTIGLSVALVLGYITQRLKASPILGYLLAGIVVGPFTAGPVVDTQLAQQLAEVGVVLLMFGVGLHFHLKDLLAVKSIAIPGAIGQSLVATALGTVVGLLAGWRFSSGLVLGIAVSVASTVVLMRMLVDTNALETSQGRIAVGWLIVEDILTVIVLVLLPITATLKPGGEVFYPVGIALAKLLLFALVMIVFGAKAIPWLLTKVAQTRSRELFTLAVLAMALAIAAVASRFFGASMALGAFLGGMIVGQSRVSDQAAADAVPMRDAFAVLFFVSVGMLFDPYLIMAHPFLMVTVMGLILVAKPVVALAIVVLLGYSVQTALTVAIGLAQIGEFSFILSATARRLGLLPGEGESVLVACALLSIALNPLLFRSTGRIERWLRGFPKLWKVLNHGVEARGRAVNQTSIRRLSEENQKTRAIVVGYGPVGQTVARLLRGFDFQTVVIDLNVDTVSRLKAEGEIAIFGDAVNADILRAAGMDKASYLVIALPEVHRAVPIVVAARQLSSKLKVFSRARYLTDRRDLELIGVTAVLEEEEAAVGLSVHLLKAERISDERIEQEVARIRAEISGTLPD